MATWTDIPNSSLEPNAPARSIDALALRDNPVAITEGASGAPRVQIGGLTDELQSLILASSSLRVLLSIGQPGPLTPFISAPIAWVGTGIYGDDFKSVWYGPNDASGSRVGRVISIYNPGQVSVVLNIKIELSIHTNQVYIVRLVKSGTALHDDGTVIETSANSPGVTYTFQPVEVATGEFAYYQLQALIGGGGGDDAIVLNGLYVWLSPAAPGP